MRFGDAIREGLGAAGSAAAFVLLCQTATAGDWEIKPTMSVNEVFTDNAALSESNPQSDFITLLRPGISIERTGAARTHVSLDFALDHAHYLRDKERKDTRKFLDAEAGAELYEDVLFLDGMASIRQVNIANTAGESGTELTDSGNRSEVVSAAINPNVRHHLRNWADYRFDYVLSNVRVADELIDTTVTQRFGSTLTSGREFSFLRWQAETRTQTTERDRSGRKDERQLAQVTLQYVDRVLFQPSASIGYETIEDNTLTEQPDGLIWSLGGTFAPGPRTRIDFSHGQRYGSPNSSLDASYEIGPRTRVTATYSQVLETSQSLSLDELNSPTAGLTQSSTGFSLTNNAFRQSNLNIGLEAERGRNTYRIEARWSERKIDADGSVNTVQGFTARWERDLTRKLTGTLNLNYRNTDFGPTVDRKDDFFTYGVQLNYRVQEDLSALIGYTGTRRNSTASGSSYTENALSFTLTANF